MTSRTGHVLARTARTPAASGTEEVLLTTTEAARHLGLTEGHVRKLARNSAIPAEQGAGGTGWRYRRAELDAWDAHRKEIERKAA
ncbi:helix-turn-helix domain-containing protein [Catenulispora yoronensis]|uniref:helix-turn-helix domain-containing protein n=1 Tax=Catenulispora yoronensis TaxID=450799 RepID=UPI0031D62B67